MAWAARTAVATIWGSLVLTPACDAGNPRAEETPLGWGGSTEAREVRHWSMASLDSAAWWRVEEAPLFELVPDSVEHFTGMGQRFASDAVFLPDGRVVVLYGITWPDSILLHILDPANGEEIPVPAPRGESGQSLDWGHFGIAPRNGGFILLGDNLPVMDPRRELHVWEADGEGRFMGRPSYIGFSARLVGTLPDRSLVVTARSGVTDSTIVWTTMAVTPLEAGEDSGEGQPEEVLFDTAVPRSPASAYDVIAKGAHLPWFASTVSGDTIWVIPTEKPELFAVHRSGRIALKVEWEAGDRSVPPGASDSGVEVDRFPAARGLKAGADGLIYVERGIPRDRRPVRDEWLVFSPLGELVARLEVPGRFPYFHAMAFGDGAVAAVTTNEETGRQKVRVYRFR